MRMTSPAPTLLDPAARARSIVATAVDVTLGLRGSRHDLFRHVVLPDGTVLFVPPTAARGAAGAAATCAEVATITSVDVAPVPQPDRVRGSLRLTGTMRPAPEPVPAEVLSHLLTHLDDPASTSPVLAFQPFRVDVTWSCDTGTADWQEVPVEEYRAAGPDHVATQEGQLLPHLQADHPDLLRHLASRAYPALDDSLEVRPLAVDRYGLSLRIFGTTSRLDVRLLFPAPLTCGCQLGDALETLV